MVLDVGSGCGASSIAAARAGAFTVIANDVDPCMFLANVIFNKVKDSTHVLGSVSLLFTYTNVYGN